MSSQTGGVVGLRGSEWAAGFPNYKLVFGLLVVWILLFVFLGNSTFGYADTPSLFGWLHYAYSIDVENQHGYIIPFVFGVLLYLKRDILVHCSKKVFWPAIAIIILAILLHLVGYIVQQVRLSIVGFVLGVYGITGLFWGWNWMRITLFPFALFAFCIPLGSYADYITFPMRMLVTKIAVGFSDMFLGIDVIREGTQIIDANRRFQYDVAPACSGIRSLFALLALTTVYSYLTFVAVWRRAVMIVMAIPLAIAGNSIRIIAVIVAGETAGQAAGAAIEQKLGFVTFLTAMAGMLAIGKLLSEDTGTETSQGEDSKKSAPAEHLASRELNMARGKPMPPAVLCCGLFILVGWFLVAWGSYQKLGEPGVALVDQPMFFVRAGETEIDPADLVNTQSVGLPEMVTGYVSTNLPMQEIVVTKLPLDTTYGQKRYIADDGVYIDNMVVLMGADRTSIHQPQYCLVGSGWAIENQVADVVEMSSPVRYELPVMRLTTSKKHRTADGRVVNVSGVYVYWFVSGENITGQHAERMWSMAKNLVMRQELERWAYITVFSPCMPGHEEETYERQKSFIREAVPLYQLFPPPLVSGSE